MTPEKEEVLREKLVELKETPRKAGEAPEKRGEPALRWRELMEISIDSDAGDLVQDVDDGVSIAVRNTAVELIEMPSVAPGTPDAGVALEFIDADGLGKLSRQSELDGLKNRLDGALRNAVAPGDFGEGDGFR